MQKNYIYNIKRIIITTIMTTLSNLVFILDYNPSNYVYFDNKYSVLYKFVNELNNCTKDFNITTLMMFIFIFYFIYHSFFNKKNNLYKYLYSFFISFMFSFITLIGKSLKRNNTLELLFLNKIQMIKSIILGIGYIFLYWSIILFLINIDFSKFTKKKDNNKHKKLKEFIKKHHVLLTFISIILLWLPIIIIFYPATATGDTVDSLAQFFNIKNLCWSAKAIKLINKNVIINKHHSVFFTILLGNIVKLGKIISSYDLGIFLFILLQVIILDIIFTFLIHYLIINKVPKYIIITSLLFIYISPIITSYAISAIKDTLASAFVLLYTIYLTEIVRNYKKFIKNKINIIFFIISILMVLMLKNNALAIILLSYTFLLLYYKNNKNIRKKLFIIAILPLFIFYCYDKILLNELEITGTNKKESYSIPFMQIARIANRGGKIYEEDQKIIDKVLSYEGIRIYYSPNLSDNVKNTYKKNVTKKELNNFWKIYFKYMKIYPKTYIASIVNSYYAYFFPESGETDGIRILDGRIGEGTIFNLSLNNKFNNIRICYCKILNLLEKIPLFCLLNHVAFYDWFLIFSVVYTIKKRNYKYLIPYITLGFIFCSCLISPVNGSFRYILSIVMSVPLILSINYFIYKESRNN